MPKMATSYYAVPVGGFLEEAASFVIHALHVEKPTGRLGTLIL
jgi:hypothetical protein